MSFALSIKIPNTQSSVTCLFLEVPRLALLLYPAEHAPRQLGEVVHAHLLIEGLEQGIHEDLEHLR